MYNLFDEVNSNRYLNLSCLRMTSDFSPLQGLVGYSAAEEGFGGLRGEMEGGGAVLHTPLTISRLVTTHRTVCV